MAISSLAIPWSNSFQWAQSPSSQAHSGISGQDAEELQPPGDWELRLDPLASLGLSASSALNADPAETSALDADSAEKALSEAESLLEHAVSLNDVTAKLSKRY